MCKACELDGTVLPSIESFELRLALPKVNYIFYEYFFKAVVGENAWKRRFVEKKRFGTNVLEAFAHAIIRNNYFAWLYDFKSNNPGTTLVTEYDLAATYTPNANLSQMEPYDSEDEQEELQELQAPFCGDLDEVAIKQPVPRSGRSGVFILLFNDGVDNEEDYNFAAKHDEHMRRIVINSLAMNRQGQQDPYKKITNLLQSDIGTPPAATAAAVTPPESRHGQQKEIAKKKRKSMRDLKMYTGARCPKKSKKDSDIFKGWSEEGKSFVVNMTTKIKDDVESGLHGEWEILYRQISKAVRVSDEGDDDGSAEELDYDVLYFEV